VSGVTWGTPVYMAPEILSAQHASTAADVYAFGVMLWELHAGQLAWDYLYSTGKVAHVRDTHGLRVRSAFCSQLSMVVLFYTTALQPSTLQLPARLCLLHVDAAVDAPTLHTHTHCGEDRPTHPLAPSLLLHLTPCVLCCVHVCCVAG
jgi:serine/threonine protein kinase